MFLQRSAVAVVRRAAVAPVLRRSIATTAVRRKFPIETQSRKKGAWRKTHPVVIRAPAPKAPKMPRADATSTQGTTQRNAAGAVLSPSTDAVLSRARRRSQLSPRGTRTDRRLTILLHLQAMPFPTSPRSRLSAVRIFFCFWNLVTWRCLRHGLDGAPDVSPQLAWELGDSLNNGVNLGERIGEEAEGGRPDSGGKQSKLHFGLVAGRSG